MKTDLQVKNELSTYEVWQKEEQAGKISLGISGLDKHRPVYFISLAPLSQEKPLEITPIFPAHQHIENFKPGAFTYHDWDGLKITEVMADFSTVHKTRLKPLKAIETYSGKMLQASDYAEVPINTEDHASVLLRFDNGNKGSVTVSQVNAGRKNRLNIEISGSKANFEWCSERPNELWIGKRETANQHLMKDPSLLTREASGLVSFPGGHNEGFPDTSKQMFKEVYAAIATGKPTVSDIAVKR